MLILMEFTNVTVLVASHGRWKGVQVVAIPHLITRSISSPELNRVIVGARAQDVSEWMPAQTPHNTVVSSVNGTNLLVRAGKENDKIKLYERSPKTFTLTQHSRKGWTHPSHLNRRVPRESDARTRHSPPSCVP